MSDVTMVSIIIPFLNEKEGIRDVLSTIRQYHLKRKFDFEIIFVDDGSKDGTAEIIKNNQPFPFGCKLISLSNNFGAHAAVRAGFYNATGKYCTCLPADLQISFDALEKLYAAVSAHRDIAFGVREINEIGIRR